MGPNLAVILCAKLVSTPFIESEPHHVRSSDTKVSLLIKRGAASSPTFHRLVDAIDAVSVIVYIEPATKLPDNRDGELLHLVLGSANMRMLRVRIRDGLADLHKVAVMAHELQHVLEAIEGGGLTSENAMTGVFAKLDRGHTRGGDPFETDTAREIESRVASELRQAKEGTPRRNPSAASRSNPAP